MVCFAAAAVLCSADCFLHPVYDVLVRMQLVWFPCDPGLCHVQTGLIHVHGFDKPPASVCVSHVCIYVPCKQFVGIQTEAKRLWKLNEALSLGVLSPLATLYAPMAPPSGAGGLPHLHWHQDRAFHTSALCSAALDSITLPYRLHSPCPTSPLGMATGLRYFNLSRISAHE